MPKCGELELRHLEEVPPDAFRGSDFFSEPEIQLFGKQLHHNIAAIVHAYPLKGTHCNLLHYLAW